MINSKNLISKVIFGFSCLVLMINSNTYGQNCIKGNAFNPVDSDGNCWFENYADRKEFFNTLITKVKEQSNGTLISLHDDIFMASIRMDDDLMYDNKEYQTIAIIKENNLPENTIKIKIEEDYPARFFYRVHFWVGENVSSAEFNLNREVPGGYFGSELVDIPYIITLTNEEGVLKSKWLKWISPIAGETNELQLTGF